jgi:hypothetical protein
VTPEQIQRIYNFQKYCVGFDVESSLDDDMGAMTGPLAAAGRSVRRGGKNGRW